MTLADRLKAARNLAGLTQAQVAEKAGIKQQSYQKLESGKSKTTSHILPLAKVLNTSPEELQFGSKVADSKIATPCCFVPIISHSEMVDLQSCVELTGGMKNKETIPMYKEGYEKCVGLHVLNDLMEPEFNAGETVIVDPDKKPVDGSFVVAHQKGAPEVMFKKYTVDGADKYLYSLKKPGPNPIEVDESIRICGVIVAVIPPLRILR